jgi:hypothetical protein
MLKPPVTKHLKLNRDILLLIFAFKFNLRCYIMVSAAGGAAAGMALGSGGFPPRLVKRVETAAIDELLAAAVPGLR